MSVSMRATFVLLATLLVAPAAYAAKPNIQWNKDYDFSHIKTFAWQNPTAPSLAQSNPFMHKFIQDQIELRLTEAGLTKAGAGAAPDVLVTYHGSVMNNVQLQSDSFGYGFGGYGMGGWGMYGYGAAGPVSTTTRVVEYLEGTLIVDIVDPMKKELVWRGSSTPILISDSNDKTEKNISKALDAMVKQNSKLRAQDKKEKEKAAKAAAKAAQ
jgi:Domain of unknown function (DUF4136)